MSQNNNIRYTVISCLAIISMVIGLFVYDTVTEKELTADQYKLLKFYKLNTKRELSDFKLASGNEAFTNDNFKDQWNLIFMGFASCPDMGPMTMNQIAKTSDLLAAESPELLKDITFTMVSVDPDRDTPTKIMNYAQAFNKDFVGVSGDVPEVVKLGYQLGVEKLAPVENHMSQRIISHTNHLIVVNSEAEVIGIFKAPFESSAMSLVIKSLLASQ